MKRGRSICPGLPLSPPLLPAFIALTILIFLVVLEFRSGDGRGGVGRRLLHFLASTSPRQGVGGGAEEAWRKREERKRMKEALASVKSCQVTPLRNISEFFSYPAKMMTPCRNKTEMGGVVTSFGPGLNFTDGEKCVCMEDPVAPRPPHCIVYSFGINFEWSFDDEMARYGCQVWSFDPTMGMLDHKRAPNLAFIDIGLATISGTVDIKGVPSQVQRLGDIKARLGHEGRRLDYLKLDIEGMEVEVLEDLLENEPHLLTFVTQLELEVHPGKYQVINLLDYMQSLLNFEDCASQAFEGRRLLDRILVFPEGDVSIPSDNIHRLWELFQKLHCLGFRLVNWSQNKAPFNLYKWRGVRQSACYEVLWVRTPDLPHEATGGPQHLSSLNEDQQRPP